jgi:hypothetical protein
VLSALRCPVLRCPIVPTCTYPHTLSLSCSLDVLFCAISCGTAVVSFPVVTDCSVSSCDFHAIDIFLHCALNTPSITLRSAEFVH